MPMSQDRYVVEAHRLDRERILVIVGSLEWVIYAPRGGRASFHANGLEVVNGVVKKLPTWAGKKVYLRYNSRGGVRFVRESQALPL